MHLYGVCLCCTSCAEDKQHGHTWVFLHCAGLAVLSCLGSSCSCVLPGQLAASSSMLHAGVAATACCPAHSQTYQQQHSCWHRSLIGGTIIILSSVCVAQGKPPYTPCFFVMSLCIEAQLSQHKSPRGGWLYASNRHAAGMAGACRPCVHAICPSPCACARGMHVRSHSSRPSCCCCCCRRPSCCSL